MSKAFDQIAEGLIEALAIARGEKKAYRFTAYAPRHAIGDWLACGWMMALRDDVPALETCYHGQFALLVEWPCACSGGHPPIPIAARRFP